MVLQVRLAVHGWNVGGHRGDVGALPSDVAGRLFVGHALEEVSPVLVHHLLKVLHELVFQLLRCSEAERPQKRCAGYRVNKDGQHRDAADVKHEVRADLRIDLLLFVHDDGENEAHGPAQAAPDHNEGLLPRDRLAETVHERPHDENHHCSNKGHGNVECHEPAEVCPGQVPLARDDAVAEEQAGEQENHCVAGELNGLPDNVYGLLRGKPGPGKVREDRPCCHHSQDAARTGFGLGDEEAQHAQAYRHGHLDHGIAVVARLRAPLDDDKRDKGKGDAEDRRDQRHLPEEHRGVGRIERPTRWIDDHLKH
mmetsp:Transcript_105918/g.299435  ORF Transcript_105918/g.299435 Transcript_105918/m.299435 type:complete len:310 (+) Transcript_105918:798-1727(+)